MSDTRCLETAGHIDVLILDKTGTLTEGESRLVDFSLIQDGANQAGSRFREEHLPIPASIERYSEHPLGPALTTHAAENGVEQGEAQEMAVRESQIVPPSETEVPKRSFQFRCEKNGGESKCDLQDKWMAIMPRLPWMIRLWAKGAVNSTVVMLQDWLSFSEAVRRL